MLPGALKAWRDAAGRLVDGRAWSQKDLADRSGVSATLIAMIEIGERQPSRMNAEDLAKALGVPLEALAFVYPDPAVEEIDAVVA